MAHASPGTEESPPAGVVPRYGTVALAGRSNVGKSTLLNRLLGAKIAITSPKPQTTRSRILGVRSLPGAQIVLLDAPGLHRARSLLNCRMVETAERVLLEADAIVAVVDAREGFTPSDRATVLRLAEADRPWLVAVNKIDLVPKNALLPLLDGIAKEFPATDLVPVSAKSGENLVALERAIVAHLPPGEPLYPADELTDQTARSLVEEFVREQIFAATRGEVPYKTAVIVERFEERPSVNAVAAAILVERPSQRRILIGEGGAMIREIGSRARRELEGVFGKRLHLELFVKVRRDWSRDPRVLDELGL